MFRFTTFRTLLTSDAPFRSATLRSPSIKATSMRYSPIPLPFAGTGEYIAASASFEQVCQLLVKGQPAERTGRRLAP